MSPAQTSPPIMLMRMFSAQHLSMLNKCSGERVGGRSSSLGAVLSESHVSTYCATSSTKTTLGQVPCSAQHSFFLAS